MFPTYDVRVAEPGHPIFFHYKAKVYQQSGENWDKVKLSVSTGNPNTNNNLPRLKPKQINFPEFVTRSGGRKGPISQVQGRVTAAAGGEYLPGVTVRVTGTSIGTTTDFSGNYTMNIPSGASTLSFSFVGFISKEMTIYSEVMHVALEEEVQTLEEVVVTESAISDMLRGKVAGVRAQAANDKETRRGASTLPPPELVSIQNTVTTEFEIKELYTILSDGQERVVELQQSSLPTQYRYYAAPELKEAAYLTARVTGWETLSVLQGEANLYFEGKFVGKSLLDPLAVSDTLEFALEVDKQVVIKREQMRDFTEKQLLGSRRKEVRANQLIVKNNRSRPINLLIEE